MLRRRARAVAEAEIETREIRESSGISTLRPGAHVRVEFEYGDAEAALITLEAVYEQARAQLTAVLPESMAGE